MYEVRDKTKFECEDCNNHLKIRGVSVSGLDLIVHLTCPECGAEFTTAVPNGNRSDNPKFRQRILRGGFISPELLMVLSSVGLIACSSLLSLSIVGVVGIVFLLSWE